MRKVRIPTYHIPTIFDLNIETLQKRGFRLILTDLDNTLDCYKDKHPSQRVIDFVKHVKESGMEIFIISNNYQKRVAPYAKEAGLEAKSFMMKPFGFKLRRLIKKMNINPSEAVMVGDQIFTDVTAGNKAGITTVFVDPLTPIDQPFTIVKRKFERPLLKKMKERNLLKEWED